MIPDTFLAGERLWLLLLLPLLVAAYWWRQRRRQVYAVRFSAVPLLGDLAARRPGWRRHVVAAGLILSLVPLVVSFARPAKEVRVPRERATIILAIDVSLSMQATDVAPSRLEAAQSAAKQFADELPAGVNVGIVAFAQSGNLLVPPTTDRAAVNRAVDNLTLGPYTAIGEAIFASLAALQQAPPDPDDPTKLPPAAVVVLSDGETTFGRPNEMAAEEAKAEGVPVSTIAFGTDDGFIVVDGQTAHVPVSKPDLEEIASITGGQAYEAATLDELTDVYKDIGTSVGYELVPDEISARWSGLGLALLVVSIIGSLGWFGRLP